MTKEMIELRNMLDDAGIEWNDASYQHDTCPMTRTHFNFKGYKWSVIHGYGSYGGWLHARDDDEGLLELMSNAIDEGNPVGWLTAKKVMDYVFACESNVREDKERADIKFKEVKE